MYSGSFLLMSVLFATLNRHVMLRKATCSPRSCRWSSAGGSCRRVVTGLIPYALATGLAFVSPYMTLAICAAVAVFYAQPIASGLERQA